MNLISTFAFVGRAKCGCVQAAVVDSGRSSEVATDVAEFILSGLTVERIELPPEGVALSKCSHKKPKSEAK